MKRIHFLYLIVILLLFSLHPKIVGANIEEIDVPCEDIVFSHTVYRNFKKNEEFLYYYLSYQDEIKGNKSFTADRVWITTLNSDTTTLIEVINPEEQKIDIISLEANQYYKLWATLRDCVFQLLFYKRIKTTTELIEDPLYTSPSTTKFLRDGQLFIRRGDKTYTIHGTAIK